MTTALVLGSAACLFDDIAAYAGAFDMVVACNGAGVLWQHDLDAWVTFHPMNWTKKGWLSRRAEAGYPQAGQLISHQNATPGVPDGTRLVHPWFPGQVEDSDLCGSSGLLAAKVALCDLGADHAVLCGIPMDERPHVGEAEPWRDGKPMRHAWLKVPAEYHARMYSMSGWTRVLLGPPIGG